ncbi:helix-turn-helix transcriptional regulator [Leptospira sp. 201903070]|uniref:Helix-turn-helix transcriptional regulator n=1 Tax=Leptospira ainlahdjerensis TaxID=2810033 RepID=A0ABS2U933_9LEPT|nr:AraC family transcriptional regulator [Leptospira ainlahdjerensis]MBM9576877.1 helix-turn-helix transcriptional regulator [Leptospira ainlahdjerensis]
MVYLDWFGNAFAIFGGFLAFLLAISELLFPKRTRFQIFFSITLILIGTLQLLNAITFQGVFQNSSLYLFLSLPILFLIGPFAYVSVQTMVEEEFRFRFSTWISLMPGIGVAIPLLFFVSRVDSFPWGGSFSNQNGAELFFTGLSVCAALYSFFFGILILRMLSSIQEKKLRLLIWICFFDFSSVAVLGILGIGFEFFFLKVSSWVISFALCLVYYVRKKYADLEETIHVELVQSKYSRSRLGGLEVDSILSELERMMKEEKIFRDEDVSLSSVAEKVSLSTHQLSELINRKLNKSFFSWLNHSRVEEAKRLLLESDKTVLEIAMEVGFNNRSSFNEAFLKFTQKTPVEYRKSSRQTRPLSYRS